MCRLLFSDQRSQQVFQSVEFDFVQRGQLSAQFAGRKAFGVKPGEVRLRQVAQPRAGIFAKGHLGVGQFDQYLRVKCVILCFFHGECGVK